MNGKQLYTYSYTLVTSQGLLNTLLRKELEIPFNVPIQQKISSYKESFSLIKSLVLKLQPILYIIGKCSHVNINTD